MSADDFTFANFSKMDEKDQVASVRRVALEDFDYFFQLQSKVDLALALVPGRTYVAPSFKIHQDFIHVRREWLEEHTGSHLIWIDSSQGVGLRVRPHAKRVGQSPTLDYDLDIEELVIRGTCLLVTVDQAEANQDIIGVLAL